MAGEKVRVKVLKAFPLNGGIQGPGEAEVPAEKVERLVKAGIIAPPDGMKLAEAQTAEVESAAARLGKAASLERKDGESVAEFLHRIADRAEKPMKPQGTRPAQDELTKDFPSAERLRAAGITKLSQVVAAPDEQLLKIEGIGADELKAIRAAQKQIGK